MTIRSLLTGVAAALSLAAPAVAETLVVSAARLVDVEHGRYIERPVVVITDGRIVSVGTEAPTGLPDDATRLVLAGLTLLPGLIDTHVHLASTPYIQGYREMEYGDGFWPILAARHAEATLEAGFTTVRSLGAQNFIDVDLAAAIDGGHTPGPRIIPSGPSFGATGGHCDGNGGTENPYSANSPDEARESVRRIRREGARVIKICATGGVFSRNTEVGQQQMSFEEMQAAVTEAHRWGLRVAAHAHGTEGINTAIRAGVDTIEHASLIDDEGIRLARQNGTWLSMDIYNTDFTQATGTEFGVTEDNLRKDREIAQLQRDNFRRAHEAGVGMIYGTDAAIYPHGWNARMFAVYVDYGMTPAEAIRTATWNAAQALDMEADVGAVAVGRYGDLIAVAGDPLTDVRSLETVTVVIKGGEVVRDAR